MNDARIVFIDCDNTLVGVDEEGNEVIPESAKKAIARARENGVKVYLCTGRSLPEMHGPIEEVEFDGIIGGSGAFVIEDGRMVYHKTMEAGDVKTVVDLLDKHQAKYMLESNSGIYANKKMVDHFMEDVQSRQFAMILKDAALADYSDINKVAYLSEELPIEDASSYLEDRYDIVNYSYGVGNVGGEISTKGVNKGSAVRYVMESKGIDKENSYSIGDSYNDVPMFENTGTSIAMGFHARGLEQVVDFVTREMEEDGVEFAFIKYKLI